MKLINNRKFTCPIKTDCLSEELEPRSSGPPLDIFPTCSHGNANSSTCENPIDDNDHSK